MHFTKSVKAVEVFVFTEYAKGDFGMPVTVRADLDHSVDRVWDMISDFGGLQRWHPLIERCDLNGVGIGSVRTVHFADWWAEETLTGFDPELHSLDYLVTNSSRAENIGAAATMALTRVDGRQTAIKWTSGLPDDHPEAATVNALLSQYYPMRLGHLADALDCEWGKAE